MSLHGGLKSNLQRISQKIEEDGDVYGLSDMVRATIIVSSEEKLLEAYKIINNNSKLCVFRCKNKLNQALQLVHINVNFSEKIIGEIQMRIGSKPKNYNANHFLYELERADSLDQFNQQVLMKINGLAE